MYTCTGYCVHLYAMPELKPEPEDDDEDMNHAQIIFCNWIVHRLSIDNFHLYGIKHRFLFGHNLKRCLQILYVQDVLSNVSSYIKMDKTS